jgi:hypothetical protein
MENETILELAMLGDQNAREERLIREIMKKEQCDWFAAQPIFETIHAQNRKFQGLINLPYYIGISSMTIMSIGSIPMVFPFDTCHWFNHFYVTTDIPSPEDLETMYEVSNWSWGWMEPPLGTISFFILCM